ncbi:hypothetical protein PHO31112_05190 [Pandoraea horticolens]|uniref:Uncharacterized protein n=1 Tax=Pandoraea horticolens TaxID=2508298 RepID=A0A5E4ZAR6_9BURK|nr:hypothetical protein PHO31112_05190 [Pandoraea horticolens]
MGHFSEQRNDALVSDIWGGMIACRLVTKARTERRDAGEGSRVLFCCGAEQALKVTPGYLDNLLWSYLGYDWSNNPQITVALMKCGRLFGIIEAD